MEWVVCREWEWSEWDGMGVWLGMYNDVIEKMIGVCVFGYYILWWCLWVYGGVMWVCGSMGGW